MFGSLGENEDADESPEESTEEQETEEEEDFSTSSSSNSSSSSTSGSNDYSHTRVRVKLSEINLFFYKNFLDLQKDKSFEEEFTFMASEFISEKQSRLAKGVRRSDSEENVRYFK